MTTKTKPPSRTTTQPVVAVPQAATSNFALKSEAALDWLTRNASHLGEVAQIALAAGVHMSPQAQTAASIAVLLGHLHDTPSATTTP